MKTHQQILEKAQRLKQLAERGVGGEKTNAKAAYSRYKKRYRLTDAELGEAEPTEHTFTCAAHQTVLFRQIVYHVTGSDALKTGKKPCTVVAICTNAQAEEISQKFAHYWHILEQEHHLLTVAFINANNLFNAKPVSAQGYTGAAPMPTQQPEAAPQEQPPAPTPDEIAKAQLNQYKITRYAQLIMPTPYLTMLEQSN